MTGEEMPPSRFEHKARGALKTFMEIGKGARTARSVMQRLLNRMLALALLSLYAALAAGQEQAATYPPRQGPPPQAYEDCKGKKAGDSVRHTTPEGEVAATCVASPGGLAARPKGAAGDMDAKRPQGHRHGVNSQEYSLAQATSDRAQLDTIAFDALAFLTGDFGYDTFLPPGKVADYFGFQYMRDIDAQGGGHNTDFLTKIADNMLAVLDEEQKGQLVALAKAQEGGIRRFAEMRLPLIKAFRLNLEGKLPAGSAGLDREAVVSYSASLYALDGELSFQRAKVMAGILRSLRPAQKAALARLKFGDSGTWPRTAHTLDRRSMSHTVDVAVMTYASQMFSWYKGSIDADTYFCPERHGMYFGGFGMKTAPAMGKRNYAISTALTGDRGEAFLATLTDGQRRQITALIDRQRNDLREIVRVRRDIATELRHFLKGEAADKAKVLALSKRYGELDGNLSYFYATAFAKVGRSLSPQQKRALMAMRKSDPSAPQGPFLYSSPIAMPAIEDTDKFFGVR